MTIVDEQREKNHLAHSKQGDDVKLTGIGATDLK